MVFGSKQRLARSQNLSLFILGNFLELSRTVKYLGLSMDWHEHINNISSKVARRLNLFARIWKYLVTDTFKLLYMTLHVVQILRWLYKVACSDWFAISDYQPIITSTNKVAAISSPAFDEMKFFHVVQYVFFSFFEIITCVFILKQLFASGSVIIGEYSPRGSWGEYSPLITSPSANNCWIFTFYYISQLVRALWLVNLAGRTSLYGPLKFVLVAKMTPEI